MSNSKGFKRSVQLFGLFCWAACVAGQSQTPVGLPINSTLRYRFSSSPSDFGQYQFNLSRLCAAGSAQLHATVTQTTVPSSMSMTPASGSTRTAYAVHTWTTVLLDSNISSGSSSSAQSPAARTATLAQSTGNMPQLYLLNDCMYLNMEDGSVAVGTPGIYLSGNLSGNPPVLDLDANLKRGQVIQNPQVLGYSSIPGAQGATAMPFKTFIPAPTASTDSNTVDMYAEVLARMWYFLGQLALGNGVCSSGYPQLSGTLNYVQEIMTNVSRFKADVDGIPEDIMFITTQQPNASCLQEPGASYKGTVAVKGASNLMQNASQCCEFCQNYSSAAGPTQIGCNAWVYCSDPDGCDLVVNSTTAATGAEATLPYKGCQLLADDGAISSNADAQVYARGLDESLISGRTTAIKPLNQTLPTGSDYPMGALSPGTVATPISLAAITPSGSIAYRRRLLAQPCFKQ